MMALTFICEECKTIIEIKVESLDYDKDKILSDNSWAVIDGYYYCDKCK